MAKKSAYGTRLLITDPADSSIFSVHHVGDISGPEIGVETIDVTAHDSPDAFAEFVGGMAEAGDVTFDLFFDPADTHHARLVAMCEERVATTMAILLPRAAVEMMVDPTFADADTYWTGGGAWSANAGSAIYSGISADDEALTAVDSNQTAVIGERYKIAVTFSGTVVGTTKFNVLVNELLIGEADPVIGGTQYFYFTAVSTDVNLVLAILGTGVITEFTIASVSVTGVANRADERFDFTGLLTKVGVMTPVKDALKASVAIKVSGKPDYTPFD